MVGVGDLIDGEPSRLGPSLLPPDFKVFSDMIRHLPCPFYAVMGNHENMGREGDPIYEKPYRDTFGNGWVNYTVEQRGILFVMLNNSGAARVNPEVIQREMSGCARHWIARATNRRSSVVTFPWLTSAMKRC